MIRKKVNTHSINLAITNKCKKFCLKFNIMILHKKCMTSLWKLTYFQKGGGGNDV